MRAFNKKKKPKNYTKPKGMFETYEYNGETRGGFVVRYKNVFTESVILGSEYCELCNQIIYKFMVEKKSRSVFVF